LSWGFPSICRPLLLKISADDLDAVNTSSISQKPFTGTKTVSRLWYPVGLLEVTNRPRFILALGKTIIFYCKEKGFLSNCSQFVAILLCRADELCGVYLIVSDIRL
jgi:hypothetical protein